METRTWEVYTLSDPRTNQVRYVGVTFRGRKRFNEHMSRAATGGRTHRDCWIRSLLRLDLRPTYQIVEIGQGSDWPEVERRWIAHYRQFAKLVNLTDGGEGTPGYAMTEEAKERLSLQRKGVPYPPGRIPAMKGKRHTTEARAKIAAAGTGRKQTESARQKLSIARKGKPLSHEHKARLGALHKGTKLTEEHKRKIAATVTNRKPVLCIETGEIYPSITAAARSLDVNEASINQAIRKGCRCKGNHFRFL